MLDYLKKNNTYLIALVLGVFTLIATGFNFSSGVSGWAIVRTGSSIAAVVASAIFIVLIVVAAFLLIIMGLMGIVAECTECDGKIGKLDVKLISEKIKLRKVIFCTVFAFVVFVLCNLISTIVYNANSTFLRIGWGSIVLFIAGAAAFTGLVLIAYKKGEFKCKSKKVLPLEQFANDNSVEKTEIEKPDEK